MEITPNQDTAKIHQQPQTLVQQQKPQETPQIKPENSSADLSKPEIIKAEIINIVQNEITIKTSAGDVYTAKVQDLASLETGIGQTESFFVRIDENGTLHLRIVPKIPEVAQKNALIESLSSLNIAPNDENLALAEALIRINLPITKENLRMLNQAVKLQPSGDPVKNLEIAAFMLENNIPPTAKNVAQIKAFESGEISLKSDIEALFYGAEKLPEGALKKEIQALLFANLSRQTLENKGEQSKNQQVMNKVVDNLVDNVKSGAIVKSIVNDNFFSQLKNGAEVAKTLSTPQGVATISRAIDVDNLVLHIKNGSVSDHLVPKTAIVDALKAVLPKSMHNMLDDEFVTTFSLKLSEKFTDIQRDFQISFQKSDALQKLHQKLMLLSPKDNDFEGILKHVNTLRDNVSAVKTLLASQNLQNNETTKPLLETATKLSESLELAAQIKSNPFLQFPINLNGNLQNAQILVLNNKSKTKKSEGAKTALIAIDTLNIGHFETFVKKSGTSVALDFKLKDKETENLVRENIKSLESALSSRNLSLDMFTFSSAEKPFGILFKENSSEIDTKPSRISFDMRT